MGRKYVNETTVRNHYNELTKLLIEKGLTITTMESCTSGQVASLITDTEGSSAVLKGAFVSYSNEAKLKLGVPKQVIEKYTVYSEMTAVHMAAACQRAFDARIGVGITGTTGNVDPANADASSPGRVYFAVTSKHPFNKANPLNEGFWMYAYTVDIPPQPSRHMYKMAIAEEVCKAMLDIVKKL